MITRQVAIDWLAEFASYFRSLGLLQGFSNLEIDELSLRLHELAWPDKSLSDLIDVGKYADIALLLVDSKSALWFDAEQDFFGNEEKNYTKLLERLAEISRNAFRPHNIVEVWESHRLYYHDTGHYEIQISFTHDGQNIKLEAKQNSDYFDFDIFYELNQLISASDKQFWFYKSNDQTAIVVVLTHAEKEKLILERAWEFDEQQYLPY